MWEILIGNRGGIATVYATQTSAGSATTDASYTLPDHAFRISGPAGIIIATMDKEVATATGITVSVNGNNHPLVDAEGEPLTILTAGDHIITFNRVANTLKLIV